MKENNLEINQTLIRPRFCDVDALKIAHHSRYVPWFEEASFNFVERVIGISREDLMNMDIYNPIASINCDYKIGIRWHNDVVISTHMYYSKFAHFTMESILTSYSDKKVRFAEARVKHLYTDKDLNLKIIAPESFYNKIEQSAEKYPEYFSRV